MPVMFKKYRKAPGSFAGLRLGNFKLAENAGPGAQGLEQQKPKWLKINLSIIPNLLLEKESYSATLSLKKQASIDP